MVDEILLQQDVLAKLVFAKEKRWLSYSKIATVLETYLEDEEWIEVQIDKEEVRSVRKQIQSGHIELDTKDSLSNEELSILSLVKDRWLNKKQIVSILNQDLISDAKKLFVDNWMTWKVKLWILSDTHIWNKLCDMEAIHQFYDICADEWVDAFINGGDLIDWNWVYKGQEFELSSFSIQDQVDEVIEKYPHIPWIKTYYIIGNHDESWIKKAGINPAELISRDREDMEYLWAYNGKININWFNIETQHWGWGSWAAISNKLQKYMDKIDLYNTDLFVLGHYHQALYMPYKGSYWILPWAFLRPNLLCKRFMLWNFIWGWIIEMEKIDWIVTHNVKLINLT